MTLIIALIKTLTLKKVKTLLKAILSFVKENLTEKPKMIAQTPYLTIEPTNRCNLRCPECITGSQEMKRPIGDLSFDLFKKIIDEVYQHTIVLNLYMQGEPYLNKNLPQMIAYAKKKNIFVSLSTNAQVLPELKSETLPHHIIVSADGATQETYEKYRVGGQLKKVENFLHIVNEYKKKEKKTLPYIELQFLVNRYNENEIKACKNLFHGTYNRFVKKTMQIIHPENETVFLPQNTDCNRYIKNTKAKPSCYKMISTTVVTQDGKILPCCMDKNAEFSYGDLQTDSIANTNKNEKNRRFHQLLLKDKTKVSICRNCPFA